MTLPGRLSVRGSTVYCDLVGFNPFREQRRGALDVALVATALLATVALLAWGFFGG